MENAYNEKIFCMKKKKNNNKKHKTKHQKQK